LRGASRWRPRPATCYITADGRQSEVLLAQGVTSTAACAEKRPHQQPSCDDARHSNKYKLVSRPQQQQAMDKQGQSAVADVTPRRCVFHYGGMQVWVFALARSDASHVMAPSTRGVRAGHALQCHGHLPPAACRLQARCCSFFPLTLQSRYLPTFFPRRAWPSDLAPMTLLASQQDLSGTNPGQPCLTV